MVEVARLESVYTLIAYRGFESLPLRQKYKNNYLKSNCCAEIQNCGMPFGMPLFFGFCNTLLNPFGQTRFL